MNDSRILFQEEIKNQSAKIGIPLNNCLMICMKITDLPKNASGNTVLIFIRNYKISFLSLIYGKDNHHRSTRTF